MPEVLGGPPLAWRIHLSTVSEAEPSPVASWTRSLGLFWMRLPSQRDRGHRLRGHSKAAPALVSGCVGSHEPEVRCQRQSGDRSNEARRFVLLIDTLYDGKVRLVATSTQAPEHIYPEGDHAFEFGRTVSRLKEMQSASWWGKKIVET